jgi:carbon storage regulator CsrA
MLILSRKKNESIVVGDNITITVVEIRGDKVRLGIVCPVEMGVHREEVWVMLNSIREERPDAAPAQLDPSWLAWNGGTVPKLARAIHDERDWERLPILADALEDAGCSDEIILAHCRAPGSHSHVLSCWAVELVLGAL